MTIRWPHHRRILIVGTGPSLAQVTPDEVAACGATIIAVKDAISWLRGADYWFSLDQRGLRMIESVHRTSPRTRMIVAASEGMVVPPYVIRLHRVARYNGLAHRSGVEDRWVPGLSEDPTVIHTGNSLWGALQVAYHMTPSRIGILGLDATQEPRLTGGEPMTLGHLPELFATSLSQIANRRIQVRNGSPASRVECFQRQTAQETLAWLASP